MTRPLWAERARGGTVHLDRNLLASGVAMIRGITGELREALLNLVQNALDAMAGGGTLGMRTVVTDTDVILEIKDSGIGMSAEVRERAFEPFFTTKGKLGTGLGLAEVYGIVKRHRGTAEIESAPGVGTTIRMSFPRATQAAPVEVSVPAARKRVARRVLLVEDHPDSREFMQALLESDGHRVDTAVGITEAMDLLQKAAPAYEVLVTDIGLADGSGWDLTTFARERWPSMRIGVVTGWEPRVGAGTDGDFILRKPVRTSELLAQVAGEG
jgi:CheY-like chemotaxis protein